MNSTPNTRRFERLRRLTPTLALLGAAGCFLFVPKSDPSRYQDTLIENLCRVAFTCCAPEERLRGLGFFGILFEEATCQEQASESFGGFFNVARDAIARGAAVHDAELAARCTTEAQAAVDNCDLSTFGIPGSEPGSQASLNLTRILLGTIDDAECNAFAFRLFARGTVAHDDECLSDVDCEDLGTCVFEGDGEIRSAKGKCSNPVSIGGDCEERSCAFGAFCNADNECEEVPLADNGDNCTDNFACDSGFCEGAGGGTCSADGNFCEFDFDCDFLDAICINDLCDDGVTACTEDFECPFEQQCDISPGECASPPAVDVEICDGQP
jgi:hypothetical protein